MTPAEPLQLSWRPALHACPLPVVIVDLVSCEVVDANDAALAFFAARDGHPVALADHIVVDDRWKQMASFVSSGTLEGFEARLRPPDGAESSDDRRIWVRALESEGVRRTAVAVLTDGGEADAALRIPMTSPSTMVAGAVDRAWACEWVTSEVTALLDYPRDAFLGVALLGLAHPDIAAELVAALVRAGDGDGGAVIHGKLRRAGGSWRDVRMILSPRPRASGAMFVLFPEDGATRRTAGDELPLATGDVTAAAVARGGDWPSRGAPHLSSRQWEIVTRLRRGQRIGTIAQAMYLSPRTVRNHLSAVYRKYGVHSQVELLAVLHDAGGS